MSTTYCMRGAWRKSHEYVSPSALAGHMPVTAPSVHSHAASSQCRAGRDKAAAPSCRRPVAWARHTRRRDARLASTMRSRERETSILPIGETVPGCMYAPARLSSSSPRRVTWVVRATFNREHTTTYMCLSPSMRGTLLISCSHGHCRLHVHTIRTAKCPASCYPHELPPKHLTKSKYITFILWISPCG